MLTVHPRLSRVDRLLHLGKKSVELGALVMTAEELFNGCANHSGRMTST
jgi:hypothetical protein